MTFALATLGVIKILSKGKPVLNGGKAAEFQFLLSETKDHAEEDDDNRAGGWWSSQTKSYATRR
jgi:hypothetical protein